MMVLDFKQGKLEQSEPHCFHPRMMICQVGVQSILTHILRRIWKSLSLRVCWKGNHKKKEKTIATIPVVFVLFALMPLETASFFHAATVLPVLHVVQGLHSLLQVLHYPSEFSICTCRFSWCLIEERKRRKEKKKNAHVIGNFSSNKII